MDHETLRPKHDKIIHQSKSEILIYEHHFILKKLEKVALLIVALLVGDAIAIYVVR